VRPAPAREGAEVVIKTPTERRSVAAVLHLFITLLLEVMQSKSADDGSVLLNNNFDLALLPVQDCLTPTVGSRTKGSLTTGGYGDDDTASDAKLTKKGSVKSSVREVRLACGYAHVLVNRCRGPPLAWGANHYGCTGLAPANAASHPPGPLAAAALATGIRVVQVAAGRAHSLALTEYGVYSWGSNRYGQLGLRPPLVRTSQPTWVSFRGEPDSDREGGGGSSDDVNAADVIVKIAAGQYHSLAVDAGGRLYSWGWGVHGQLGHTHTNVEDVDRPTVVGLLRRHAIVDAAAGFAHSLVLTAEGRVLAFGLGLFGQLGSGTTAKSSRPVPLPLLHPVRLIATGYFHSLAVLEKPAAADSKEQGLLYQWGAHPQILRLEAQQRRKERILAQKSASKSTSRKSKGQSSSSCLVANGGPAGYCNGGPPPPTHCPLMPVGVGGTSEDEPLDLSFSSPSKLLDVAPETGSVVVPLDLDLSGSVPQLAKYVKNQSISQTISSALYNIALRLN
jgi:alpha-tubulin suppressor-like RCC1 family protein